MTKQLKADLALLSITIVWGSSFIIMKNISEDIPAYVYLSLRFSVAAILLVIIFNKHLKNISAKALIAGSVVGLFVFAGMMLQVVGLQTTSASNSGFITGLNVVMVPIISVILLKKRPSTNALIGVALATFGLFMLKGFTGNWVIGDTLTLLCAFCFAFQIIFIDKFAWDVDIYQLAIIQIASAAVLNLLTWIVLSFVADPIPVVIDGKIITVVLYTGVFGTAFGYGVQTIAQKYTSPTRTALIIACEPVFAVAFALMVPDVYGKTEVLSIQTILGSLLILSGMIITSAKTSSTSIQNDL